MGRNPIAIFNEKAVLRLGRGMNVEALAALCDGSRFAPAPLSPLERSGLEAGAVSLADAPPHVAGDFPEWLSASLQGEFGSDLAGLPAAVVEQFDYAVLSRGKALPGAANFGAYRE